MSRSPFIESLEPRRMLAFTASGTSGDDQFEVLPSGDNLREVTVMLNGQFVGETQDTDIQLFGLGGNDSFFVGAVDESNNQSQPYEIQLSGGADHDLYRIDHAGSIVRMNEAPAAGSDVLIVEFIAFNPDFPPTPFTLRTQENAVTTKYLFDDNLEAKEVHIGDYNLDLSVSGPIPSGFHLRLGNATNVVKFIGNNKQINEDFLPGQVTGGSGVDKVVFDDSSGNRTVRRDYAVLPSGIMNQTLLDIENAEIKVRLNNTGTPNKVLMTGTASVNNSLTVTNATTTDTALTPTLLSIGTQAAPLDLDSLAFQVNGAFLSTEQLRYEIWDQDADRSGAPFLIDGNANLQIVQKGNFIARLNNSAATPSGIAGLRLDVNGGSANDMFQVRDTLEQARVFANGGGGGDTLMTVDDPTHGSAPEQVFLGLSFSYDGGADDDLVMFDDRDAPFPGIVDEYLITSGFTKNGVTKMTHSSVERVDFIAGGQTNVIRIDTRAGGGRDKSYRIDAQFGSDTITTFVPGLGGGALGASVDIELVGGGGNDTLVIDDALAESQTSQYALDTNEFSYSGDGSGSITFDTTLENIIFVANNRSSTTQLRGKRSGMSPDFNAGGGNDQVIFGGGDLNDSGLFTNTTLTGGAGTDEITFDDHLDNTGKSYTFNLFELAVGSQPITHSSFESQALLASGGGLTPTMVNTINLNAISNQFQNTTILGRADRNCTVNVAAGNLDTLGGVLNLNLPAASDRVIINDQNVTTPIDYTFDATRFEQVGGQVINFTGVEVMTLNAGAGDSNFAARGTPAGLTLAVNAGAGNDILLLGNGNISSDLLGQVIMHAGPTSDVDLAIISNDEDTGLSHQTLIATSFTDGRTHSFFAVDSLRIFEGPGGTNLTVNSATVATTVQGGTGNDTFTVGGGNIAANFSANINLIPFFDGGGGTDAIILDDRNGPATGSGYEFQRPFGIDRLSRGFGGTYIINWANMESATLEASDAPTTGTTTSVVFAFQSLTPLRINGNGGSDLVFVMDTAHPVFVNTGTGDHDQIDVNLSGGAPATAIIDEDDEVNGLMVRPGGTLRVASGATLAKSQVSGVSNYFDLTGTLDLAGGALLSRAGGPTLTQFGNQIIAGRNGGAWNGTSANGAINSSLAAGSALSDGVGHGLGSQIAPTMIGPFSIASGDTLVRYTLDGDANHDGTVDVADLGILASNWQQSQRTFAEGNFDYSTDGLVGVNDLGMLATNWQQQLAAPSATGSRAATSASHRPSRLLDQISELSRA